MLFLSVWMSETSHRKHVRCEESQKDEASPASEQLRNVSISATEATQVLNVKRSTENAAKKEEEDG